MAKSKEKTTNLAERFSKIWIYTPLYLLLVSSTSWGLFSWLNSAPPVEQKKVIKSNVPPSFVTCFNDYKSAMGGTFGMLPTKILMTDFEALDKECYEKICQEFKSIENGYSTAKDFYRAALRKDMCFLPILNEVLAYHNDQLKKHPMRGFFYNSGQHQLSGTQKNLLSKFLDGSDFSSGEKGLLIIGRASKIGNELSNKKLSRRRAEEIIQFVEYKVKDILDTDFVYLGSDPPQLNKNTADALGFKEREYENISYGRGEDNDYSLRLNQSVLLVVYNKKENPFDL